MNILQRLSEIHELPTLPEVLLKVQALISSDDGDAQGLARIIEQDPPLAAKILKVANSSFYGVGTSRINSVQLAITRIGFNEVGHIVMAISVIRQFSKMSNTLDYKQFWRHSLAAAFLTRMVAGNSGVVWSAEQRNHLFFAGLLHDIGIFMYDQFFHSEFEIIIKRASELEVSYLRAEEDSASHESHALLGSALLEKWRLDPAVVCGVRYHHFPDRAPENYRTVAAAAYLAEYVLCNSSIGSFEGLPGHGNRAIVDMLQITPDALAEYLVEAEIEVARSDLFCSLDTSDTSFRLRAV